MSLILRDSFSGMDLRGFADEQEVVKFIDRVLNFKCMVMDIESISKINGEFLGYKWSYGVSTNNYPELLILSMRFTKQTIDNFFKGLKEACERGKYIIHHDKKISEEFNSQKEIAEYFQITQAAVNQRLKKGNIKDKNTGITYELQKVNMKPMIEFELLDYKLLLKYAKNYQKDNSFIDLLVDLDVEDLDYEIKR